MLKLTMLTKFILQSTLKSHQSPLVIQMFFHSKYEGEQHRAIKKKTDKKLTQKSQEPPYKCLTMDDMLIPCGDWKEHYSRRNKNYNIIFAVGLVSLIGSIYICNETVFFNAFPPPYPFPAEEENMVRESE